MAKTRKRLTMTVTVSCPRWLSAAQARKEVRALINDQTFFGHHQYAPSDSMGRDGGYDEIGEDNFRAVSVRP